MRALLYLNPSAFTEICKRKDYIAVRFSLAFNFLFMSVVGRFI